MTSSSFELFETKVSTLKQEKDIDILDDNCLSDDDILEHDDQNKTCVSTNVLLTDPLEGTSLSNTSTMPTDHLDDIPDDLAVLTKYCGSFIQKCAIMEGNENLLILIKSLIN